MTTINTAVVGAKFHDGAFDALFKAEGGDVAELVREPGNKFDPNAVRIHVGGVMCGFVPRAQAERLAADMDAGKTVTAKVYGTKIEIEVREKDDD